MNSNEGKDKWIYNKHSEIDTHFRIRSLYENVTEITGKEILSTDCLRSKDGKL